MGLRPIIEYRSFINEDPIIDYLNKYHGNYKKDSEWETFDKQLMLDYHISKYKNQFIENIKKTFNDTHFYLYTNIGKAHFIIKTSELHKYFINSASYATGQAFSMFTVEYSSLNITADFKSSNTKSQRYYNFYNWAMQKECKSNGIDLDYSFIIGRKYKMNNGPVLDRFNYLIQNTFTFDSLLNDAHEHFNMIDNYVIGKNLFPNMKYINDFPWHSAKKIIAKEIEEITMLRGWSVNHRNIAVSQGNTKYSEVANIPSITTIPRSTLYFNHLSRVMYIDFEILSNIHDDFSSFPVSNSKSIIFNIGCGYGTVEFEFKSYFAYTLDQEYQILLEFISFLNSMEEPIITFVYWTNVEKNFLEKAIKEYSLVLNKELIWLDLCDFFIKNDISVANCLNYKLKYICRELHSQGLIESAWGSSFADGLGAMTGYLKYLDCKDASIPDDIIYYNKIDCKVMWEIVKLLIN